MKVFREKFFLPKKVKFSAAKVFGSKTRKDETFFLTKFEIDRNFLRNLLNLSLFKMKGNALDAQNRLRTCDTN